MSHINCQEAARVFSGVGDQTDKLIITPVKGGLINLSCLVRRTDKGTAFILQQINNKVFREPAAVQENYLHLWRHVTENKLALRLPQPLPTGDNNFIYTDSSGNYWRACEFIEGSFSPAIASHPQQASATAKVFGEFNASFKDIDIDSLHIVIPNFHNLDSRFAQFTEAHRNAAMERKEKVAELVNELLIRSSYKDFYNHITSSPDKYPKRVMHHDAKIANVLFDKETHQVLCLVDLDTVMPGYYFSDLGDMIRSMACNFDESHRLAHTIRLREDFYEAIIAGYLQVMKEQLTVEEQENIHFAGILMIYMQALRFLGDYLNGDIYYQIDYPEQNIDRAANQIALLKQLETYLHTHQQSESLHYLPAK